MHTVRLFLHRHPARQAARIFWALPQQDTGCKAPGRHQRTPCRFENQSLVFSFVVTFSAADFPCLNAISANAIMRGRSGHAAHKLHTSPTTSTGPPRAGHVAQYLCCSNSARQSVPSTAFTMCCAVASVMSFGWVCFLLGKFRPPILCSTGGSQASMHKP